MRINVDSLKKDIRNLSKKKKVRNFDSFIMQQLIPEGRIFEPPPSPREEKKEGENKHPNVGWSLGERLFPLLELYLKIMEDVKKNDFVPSPDEEIKKLLKSPNEENLSINADGENILMLVVRMGFKLEVFVAVLNIILYFFGPIDPFLELLEHHKENDPKVFESIFIQINKNGDNTLMLAMNFEPIKEIILDQVSHLSFEAQQQIFLQSNRSGYSPLLLFASQHDLSQYSPLRGLFPKKELAQSLFSQLAHLANIREGDNGIADVDFIKNVIENNLSLLLKHIECFSKADFRDKPQNLRLIIEKLLQEYKKTIENENTCWKKVVGFFKCHHSVQQISRATSELEEILNQQENLDNERMDDLLHTFPALKQEPLRRLLEILCTGAEDSPQAALLQNPQPR
ncbi:CBU_0534 family Dot/Icm T4SS effector [Coxiella burnetii]|uniref:Hypothetical membrane associated protein n=1 Tax=Coxiella burnetii (strain RSA 493 / Nine Mile phase I) TaxID=227377 RepID=Q83E03_COXBU|nr:CBU_0534 family Dot/Icm T4SS effector [Coxiella burnetii]NP_819566.1 membrane-associated protein [Coxiella burnetii RSA 493]AAO90080.1 hypothetical membrane associated protein [Coxiella burnetii RSA 493]ARI65411.1 hypothetical protein B7L74_02775 [Coxiella burnetii]ARK26891.1 hypothetical protein BMW92_02700 [Coxiella burnetii]MCF2094114.1 CBU_0534 family Dot/Icm T4SS effector [Coxiella burnetii]MCF2096096.1 CBU_0534 family Dot/Icm T4SS effector [Coxiella burnetii]